MLCNRHKHKEDCLHPEEKTVLPQMSIYMAFSFHWKHYFRLALWLLEARQKRAYTGKDEVILIQVQLQSYGQFLFYMEVLLAAHSGKSLNSCLEVF